MSWIHTYFPRVRADSKCCKLISLGQTLPITQFYVSFQLKDSLCGYQIRLESRTGEATRLLYCTTGVLLRKLQEDVLLSNVSHVIVDEVSNTSVVTKESFELC